MNNPGVRQIVSSKALKCFYFSNKEKPDDEPKTTKSNSLQSSITSTATTTERFARRSGSDFGSQNVSDTSTESSTRNSFAVLSQKHSNNLRVFMLEELKTATKNFSRSLMIGEGGFGGVYHAMIHSLEDSRKMIDVAVKQLSRRGLQGHKEWVTEVNVLGFVEHPNLVKLVGYCAEDDERGIQRLLVYEYMPNRSVQDSLSNRFQTTLPWSTRMKIAQDTARGLAYLHEGLEFQIIFRDFKSSNILLDENWSAKLSDFGLVRMGPAEGITHVSTAELSDMRHQNTSKQDASLLKATCGAMVSFCMSSLPEGVPLTVIAQETSRISSLKLAAVANRCLTAKPKSRPKMSQVLDMINQIVEKFEAASPALPLVKSLTPKDALEISKRERVKRRVMELLIGGKGCPNFPNWTPKLVPTC